MSENKQMHTGKAPLGVTVIAVKISIIFLC